MGVYRFEQLLLFSFMLMPAVLTAPLEKRQSGSNPLYGSPSLGGYNPKNPVDTGSTVIPPSEFELAPGQSEDAELGLFLNLENVKNPQPIRGSTDAPTDPGPRNLNYDRINSDLFIPPTTDKGSVPNAKWPFGLSHNRHGTPTSAGWAREQTVQVLPAASQMAGVDMRLEPHAYRELHWHKANEWSLILKGSVRLAAVDEDGETFVDDLQEGDVWFFPAGVPHSIQALEGGVEFLLVFDDGSFSEDNTFLASELFARNPQEVLAKNFRTNVKAFKDIPQDELYIFPGTPAPEDIEKQNVTGPAGIIPQQGTYSYHWSQQQAYPVPGGGGTVKILDSTTFPVAKDFAAALVTIEPGAIREMHWHTTSDEWNYFLQGSARVTVFDAPEASRTFDYSAGDVGYIPVPNAHYIENTGNETVIFLEVLQAPRFTDISVGQWLALTPKQVVQDTLHLSDELLDSLPKQKQYVIAGNPDPTTTDFTPSGSRSSASPLASMPDTL